jgi:hypothetical protein
MRTIDQQLDARNNRRHAAQARAEARREQREKAANAMIGELASGLFYVYPIGGQYCESADRYDLIAYLISKKFA